jgi:sialate O-acetylesterase
VQAAIDRGVRPGNVFIRKQPNLLYNAMLHPVIPYASRGMVWYQGEANVGRGDQYRTLLPTLIADWRQQWKTPQLPFLIVQLAPFR